MKPDEKAIWEALREVIDPELGINIVDLGLVYEVNVYDTGDVQVVMTMTTPACPLSSYFEHVIPMTLKEKVEGIGVVSVVIVWEPRWDPGMMSPDAVKALGWAP